MPTISAASMPSRSMMRNGTSKIQCLGQGPRALKLCVDDQCLTPAMFREPSGNDQNCEDDNRSKLQILSILKCNDLRQLLRGILNCDHWPERPPMRCRSTLAATSARRHMFV